MIHSQCDFDGCEYKIDALDIESSFTLWALHMFSEHDVNAWDIEHRPTLLFRQLTLETLRC